MPRPARPSRRFRPSPHPMMPSSRKPPHPEPPSPRSMRAMDHAPGRPPRSEDVFRHLEDLRTGTFEGAESREDRVALFRRAVDLLDPVVREVLDETNATFLDGSGQVDHRSVHVDGNGDAVARWELSWPEQRQADNVRPDGGVPPIQV